MVNSIWLYRMYDVAEEFDLNVVQSIVRENQATHRMRLARVRAKSMIITNPPVSMDLGATGVMIDGVSYNARIMAKVYDLGVISLNLRVQLPENISFQQLLDLSIHLNQTAELDDQFRLWRDGLIKQMGWSLRSSDSYDFVEDLTVFFFQHWPKEWDPVPILLAEKDPLSPQVRQDTLRNSFAFGEKDLAIITWDAALVYDEEGSTDIPELLEFATTQLLELRYYDDLLSGELSRMQDALEAADKERWYLRLRQYRDIMKKVMKLVVDITEITDRIKNSLKVTEDIFYAKVYGAALTTFRTQSWMDSIQHKLSIIQRNYSMLSDEVINHRSMLLELAIVALFIFEIVLAFWKEYF